MCPYAPNHSARGDQRGTRPRSSRPSSYATCALLLRAAAREPVAYLREKPAGDRRGALPEGVTWPRWPRQAWSSSACPSRRLQGAPCVSCRTGILAPALAVSVSAQARRRARACAGRMCPGAKPDLARTNRLLRSGESGSRSLPWPGCVGFCNVAVPATEERLLLLEQAAVKQECRRPGSDCYRFQPPSAAFLKWVVV